MNDRNYHSNFPLRLLGFAILTLCGLLTAACDSSPYLSPCTTRCVEGGIRVSFQQNLGSVSAWSLYETHEVDPNVYAHDSTSTPTGTMSVTLTNGSTVTYSGNLYLDTSTTVTPTTSGYDVLVYRPVDPSGLQAFIDQYKDTADSVAITTKVRLKDISGGTVSSSVVDFKANYETNLEYVGSVNSVPPSYDPLNKDV